MATINDTGQVTIPEPIREALGLRPGGEVEFEYQGNGKAVMRCADETAIRENKASTTSRFARLRGSLKSDLTTDEILAMTRGED